MTQISAALEADERARTVALDVSRSFIIQAPAGSGKTELLIQRYLSLMAVVDHPEEVIAITFTRKAAAEMQLRVLDALRRASEGKVPSEAHEQKTFELASAALARSSKLDWNLIGNPRRMRIMTLDALNASITRTLPLSPNGTGSRIVVGAELDAVYEAAAVATLDWLGEPGGMRDAAIEVLEHVDNNTWLYTSYLARMLATRDQWLPFVGSGLHTTEDTELLRQRFEESLELAVNEHLRRTTSGLSQGDYAELTGLFDYCAANLVEAGDVDNPICNLAGLSSLPNADAACISQWLGVAELLMTRQAQARKVVNKNQGFPPGNKEQKDCIQAILARLAADEDLVANIHGIRSLPPTHYSDEQWRVLVALFRILPLAVSELQRLFGERGVGDHIDVALLAGDALGSAENPGDLALLLDYQVRHLLVDEMQDTSAAQYRMIETLIGGWQDGDGRTICCVGDPMQSIYRFRNAEVGQFLLAQEFGLGQIRLEKLLLQRNFRSGERLVDWFNAVFPGVLAKRDDPFRAAVSYAEAVPVPQHQGQGQCVVHPIFGSNSDDEAAAGCKLIAKTLADNPDDDMAVLVRGRTHLPQLLADLRANGIPYRAIEIDRLTDLPEIIDVLALTRAAAHPGDRIAWLGVLRSAWIGLSWADLHALVRNDSHSTIWALLQDPARLARLSDSAQTAIGNAREHLTRLVNPDCTVSLRDRIEATWFALGGPGLQDDDYAIENVYRYFDVLGKLERAGTIVDVGDLESILDLERVSSNDKARLQVMTMHRSKGLQFDHVLLFGLGRQPGHGDRRVLSWFDLPARHGNEYKVISPVGPRAEVDNDPVHRYIELTESDKARHEQGRLLYVACTRARKSLHLMGHTEIATDGQGVRPARSDSLLHRLWPVVEEDFGAAFDPDLSLPTAAQSDVWSVPVLRRFASSWALPEPKSPPGDAQPATELRDDEVEFYWVGTDARVSGTLVHRWLQLIADGTADTIREKPDDMRDVTLRWLRENGIDGDAASPIVERVLQAVQLALGDDKGRWIIEGEGHSELALSGLHADELVSVVLDRVRIDEDGTHWIIDYKTSSHEGGNLEGFLQVEAERYRPQLERYRTLYSHWAGVEPRCALYFPLLTSFVEVEAQVDR